MRVAQIASGWAVVDEDALDVLLAESPAGLLGSERSGEIMPMSKAVLEAPVPAPSKIICVGFNYGEHVKDLKLTDELPREPVFFLKPPSAVIGPGAPIVCPAGVNRVDPEVELAIVIGRKFRGGDPADAILGYTILNDVTARDFQTKGSQWFKAKGFDTFCPMGPWIETELDPRALDVELRINGKTVQKSNTRHMLFDAFELVKRAGEFCTLYPGDVISTGTPAGVSPVRPGDVVECEIEGIGMLKNPVV